MPAKKPTPKKPAAKKPVARKKAAPKKPSRSAAKKSVSAAPKMFRVVFEVENLDAAASGYGKLLGDPGRRIARGGRHYFDLDGAILGLLDVALGGKKAQPSGSDLYVTVQDLEPVHARAGELGWLSDEDVHGVNAGDIAEKPWGERSFYVEDPWGNGLCFIEAGTEFTGR